MIIAIAAYYALSAVDPSSDRDNSCTMPPGIMETRYRLAALPPEIQHDLAAVTENQIRENSVPLLNTDAPTVEERNHATVRFVRAVRTRLFWVVQLEIAMVAGVRTVSYIQTGHGTRSADTFVRSNLHDFAGPACESLRAALGGVTTSSHISPLTE